MHKIRRKESVDSENDTQGLLSSDGSETSFGGYPCMFPGSETSDFDQSISNKDRFTTAPFLSRYKNANPNYREDIIRPPPFTNFGTNTRISNKYDSIGVTLPKSPNYISDNHLFAESLDGAFSMQKTQTKNTQSSIVTVFSIWNTSVGSSLLTMAWGIEKSGLVSGVMLTIFISAICLYTCYALLQVSRDHGLSDAEEVPELCRHLLGPWAEYIAKTFSIIVLLGASVVYWVLMSNFLYYSVHFIYDEITDLNVTEEFSGPGAVICPKAFSENGTHTEVTPSNSRLDEFNDFWNLYSTVPVFLGFIMFPLMNFKNTTFFTKFNCLGTVSVAYLLIFVATKASIWGINFRAGLPFIKPTFTALTGMLSLSFFIHNIIISIVKRNHNQQNNGRDLSLAFVLVTITYIFVGAFFYVCFPLAKSCIEDNIFNNFDKWDPMTVVARLLLLFQIITTYPLITFMLRKNVLSLFLLKNDQENKELLEGCEPKYPIRWVVTFNVVTILICIMVACFLPKVGTLVRYTGAISGVVYIFTLPSLLKLVSLRKQNQLNIPKIVFFTVIPIIGTINLFSQFFISA